MDSHRIEFFGLPGCGKTFLVEKITSIDRKTLSQKATNKYLQMIKKLSKFSPTSLYYKFRLRKILANSTKHHKYHDTNWNDMLDSIVLVASAYKMRAGGKGVLDEGIVQRTISFAINYDLDGQTIIKILESFESLFQTTDVIFVEISSEEAFKSIKERNRKESKMDFFSDETLLDYLKEYEVVCKEIAEHFHFKTLHKNDFGQFIEERKIR